MAVIHTFAIEAGTLKNTATFVAEATAAQGHGLPLMTVGRETYIVGASIHRSPAVPELVNIHVGAFCSIATDVAFLTGIPAGHRAVSSSVYLGAFDNEGASSKGQIVIQNDVWIGHHVKILPGVTVGNGAVIAAGTVVSADVPPYAIVGGDPQRLIRYRFPPAQIERLLDIAWWHWSYRDLESNKHWFLEDPEIFIEQFHHRVRRDDVGHPLHLQVKTHAFLFFPDMFDAYPLWEHVMAEYRRNFTVEDDVSLILRLPNDERFAAALALLAALDMDTGPDVLVVNDRLPDERTLFSHAGYFITSRSKDTVRHTEYADQARARVLSGVDRPVFDRQLVAQIRTHSRPA